MLHFEAKLFFMLFGIFGCYAANSREPYSDLFRDTQRISQSLNNPQIFNNLQRQPASTANNPQTVNGRISDVIAANVLKFALDIGHQLSQLSESSGSFSKSEVFSPLSVMSALALILLGAKGKSYQELQHLFGIDSDAELRQNPGKFHEQLGLMISDLQKPYIRDISPQRLLDNWRYSAKSQNSRNKKNKSFEHILKLANGLFTQIGYTLNPNYKNVVASVYHSELSQLDFQRSPAQSALHINDWVELNTNGKIPNIIEGDIDSATNVILASALYFKGFWETDFIEAGTKFDHFYPDGHDGQPIMVKMMVTGGSFPFYDAQEYGCRIIGLPYKGNMTTMYVIQPYQSTRAILRDFQTYLNAGKVEDMISKMVYRTASLAFPKMHLKRTINMKRALQRTGIKDIFVNGVSDLSLIGESQSAASAPVYNPRPMSSDVGQRVVPLDRNGEKPFIFVRSSFVDDSRDSINALDAQRSVLSSKTSDLFVDDIVHKVDFDVNETGTEAAAATLTYLKKSGPDVSFRVDAPFLLLIRHDPTKLALFYGIINEPVL